MPAETVRGWPEAYRDEHLHALSRWDGFNGTQWKQFVDHSYAPLPGLQNATVFRFLEVGVGVGAWARHFLAVFPNATGAVRSLRTSFPSAPPSSASARSASDDSLC